MRTYAEGLWHARGEQLNSYGGLSHAKVDGALGREAKAQRRRMLTAADYHLIEEGVAEELRSIREGTGVARPGDGPDPARDALRALRGEAAARNAVIGDPLRGHTSSVPSGLLRPPPDIPSHAPCGCTSVPSPPMPTEPSDRRADCDVLIIGGGVNGTGLARDLSLRGLRVELVERNDLGFGASGNSSGMIHGGPRYLTSHPEVTRSSCEDSGYIQRIAPHMIFRIPFVMPVYGRGTWGRVTLEAIDAFFAVYDEYQPLKRGKPHARLDVHEATQLVPGLNVDGMNGVITFDEWGINGVRLCVANAVDAREHGATLHTHTTVERVVVTEGRATGALLRDRLTGRSWTVTARAVVNCTGAWGPITAGLAGLEGKVKLRPGKGVHLVLDRPISDVAVMASAVDGRQIFVEPWGNTAVIGTTDDDTYDDLDDLPVTVDEVRYLVEGIERVLPRVREARIISTTVGARPTLYEWGKMEDALSREHAVLDHASDGVTGLWSLVGGKLASYRQFAQEAADIIAPWLGNRNACSTHESPLPGGDREVDVDRFAEEHEVTRWAAARLVNRHGTRAADVLG